MELQDRYDELQDVTDTIKALINRINDKSIIEDLRNIQIDADNEIKEIKPKLYEQYEKEERELENQYWRDAI